MATNILDEASRVVFDTDAGVDDAIALLMILHGVQPESVVGITTVFGNVSLHQANRNVSHILEAMNRTDVPIFSGASRPIISSVSEEKWAGHGPDGMGGQVGIAETPLETMRHNEAVRALIDLSYKFKGQLVVVAVGPLTNVALAMLLDPNFVRNVKHFVVMGGLSRGEGNMGDHAEFNVGCDPEATSIVYQHCLAQQLWVVPFETTTDHGLPWSVFDELFDDAATPISAYIKRVWTFTKGFSATWNFVACDAYAVGVLLDPAFVKTARVLKGQIHLGHDEHRGACIWSEDENLPGANVTLVTEVHKHVFTEMLRRLAREPPANT